MLGAPCSNDLHVVFDLFFVNAVEEEHAAAAAAHQGLVVTHADVKPLLRSTTHYVTAHCRQDSKEHLPDVYLVPQVPAGAEKCFSPVVHRSMDQGSVQQLLHHRYPDLKPLMAMSLHRPYTGEHCATYQCSPSKGLSLDGFLDTSIRERGYHGSGASTACGTLQVVCKFAVTCESMHGRLICGALEQLHIHWKSQSAYLHTTSNNPSAFPPLLRLLCKCSMCCRC